jgi:class 3 adenylate cyclase
MLLNSSKSKQSFYQQNIILSIYITSILVVGMVTKTFEDSPIEFIVYLTIYPHLLEVIMAALNKKNSFIATWIGVIVSAGSFPFVADMLGFEITLTGLLLLLISYQSLYHLGFRGWVTTILISCIGLLILIYSKPYLIISKAPFQLLIIGLTCGLFFMFHSAGNAYENVSLLKKNRKEIDELYNKNKQWISVISRYLSPKIVHEIVNDKVTGNEGYQRKEMTIFFSDIVGFTSISEKIKPDELAFYLNYYLGEMSIIADEYGATVDKFIGDGIMIFFGDPDSLGPVGDTSKAVEMAIAMQLKMTELNAKWHQMNFEYKFDIRIGIHHGVATVGNFGSDSQVNYTVIGNDVNIAARLEQAAKPQGILVSANVRDLLIGKYDFSDKEALKLKGLDNPVEAFHVSYNK